MRKIVIAPNEAHINLYQKYRKDNPFCDVKFFSKSSFLKRFYYQYNDEAIIYLIRNKKLDYDLASSMLRELVRLNPNQIVSENVSTLIDYQKELLDKGLLYKDEYFDHLLNSSLIEIYFYSSFDKELLVFLKDKNYKFIEPNGKKVTSYYNFSLNNDELTYVFNEIARLISEGVSPKNISLYGLSEDDELTFKRLSKNYGINFNNAYPKTYLDKKYISKFLSDLMTISFEEAFENAKLDGAQDETFADFCSIIEGNHYLDLNIQNQISLYRGLLKKKRIKSTKYVEAVEVVSEPIAKENGYLFILNFIQGKCPILSKDNKYLSDKEKTFLGVATSEDENAANLDQFKKYLQQNANIYVSLSNRSYSQNYYPSPLIKTLNLKQNQTPIIYSYYSLDEAKISYINVLDLRTNYLDNNPLYYSFLKSGIDPDYSTYNYQFDYKRTLDMNRAIKLSYSSLDEFVKCQYRYYLNRVLNLGEFEASVASNIGNIAHYIFEHINEKEYDELFDDAVKNLKQTTRYEWIYYPRVKKEFKNVYEKLINFESDIKYSPLIEREKTLNVNIGDNVTLNGRIDKAITFGNNNQYLAIIDYKTGSTSFSEEDLEFGLSMQLPTYGLMARKDPNYSEKEIAALLIHSVLYSKQIETKVEECKAQKPTMNGVVLNDPTILKEFDPSLENGKSLYIHSLESKLDDNGHPFFKSSNAKSKETIDSYIKIAEKTYKDVANKIRQADFEINPKIKGGKNISCEFCEYRDICYRDYRSYRILEKKVEDSKDGD